MTAWADAHSATLNVNLGTSYTIKSLTNGTEYEVQVRATNAKGDGAWSDTASATPADTAPDFGSESVENQK